MRLRNLLEATGLDYTDEDIDSVNMLTPNMQAILNSFIYVVDLSINCDGAYRRVINKNYREQKSSIPLGDGLNIEL